MYVRAVLQEGVNEAALLVPQQAVTRAPDGSASTLVVGADDKVARRPIKVGRAVGNRWQLLDGLAAGDRVLVEGSQRARVGDTVKASEVAGAPGAATPAAPAAPAASGSKSPGAAGPGPVASAAPATAPAPALPATVAARPVTAVR
jgi:membrane fusion protein (multidrug efflux system)